MATVDAADGQGGAMSVLQRLKWFSVGYVDFLGRGTTTLIFGVLVGYGCFGDPDSASWFVALMWATTIFFTLIMFVAHRVQCQRETSRLGPT